MADTLNGQVCVWYIYFTCVHTRLLMWLDVMSVFCFCTHMSHVYTVYVVGFCTVHVNFTTFSMLNVSLIGNILKSSSSMQNFYR